MVSSIVKPIDARMVLRAARAGVVASVNNVDLAHAEIQTSIRAATVINRGVDVDLHSIEIVLSSLRQGVLPSEAICNQAIQAFTAINDSIYNDIGAHSSHIH
ncbi:MAG TPA: hypothetical protein VK147_02520 [Candidatus Didemnitutus sp.]|nr:hypothetical protein [Candidatus Didemnitutus sp.]